MFSPEREPHPSVSEIKYLQQPAAISLPDSSLSIILTVPRKPGATLALLNPPKETPLILLKVLNRYAFRDLSHLIWKWSLLIEYHPEAKIEGFATICGETLIIGCSSIHPHLQDLKFPKATGTVFLNVYGILSSNQSWAKARHIIVSEQFPVELIFEAALQQQDGSESMNCPSCLPVVKSVVDSEPDPTLTVWQDTACIFVSREMNGRPFVIIDKKSGGIKSIIWEGRDMLHGNNGIRPNFTRATTDNDRGGMELVLDFLRIPWAKPLLQAMTRHLFSYEMHWRDHGISQDAPPISTCDQSTVVSGTSGRDDSICIETSCSIRKDSGQTILYATHAYTIFADGRIRVDVKVTPNDCIRSVPSLPRVGLSLSLSKEFHRVKYFGRGPNENYTDRKSGSPMGSWQTSPAKMGFDYIVPSENGSRSDCKWASFQSNEGGLIVLTESDSSAFNFSALLHTTDELHRATHTCDLVQRLDGEHPVHVNIDHKLMGVGGDVRYAFLFETEAHQTSRTWYAHPTFLPINTAGSPVCTLTFL